MYINQFFIEIYQYIYIYRERERDRNLADKKGIYMCIYNRGRDVLPTNWIRWISQSYQKSIIDKSKPFK